MVRLMLGGSGEIVVDGKSYCSDMIVWWDGECEFVKKDHMLDMRVFSRLLRRKPGMVVIGTGEHGRLRLSDHIRHVASDKGVRLIEETSGKAAKTFNDLAGSGKKVVAFIHATC